jgi:GTP cyclohydrolase I
VKDQLRGQGFEAREVIQKAVRQCLRMAGTEFYRRAIFKLPERWEKCVQKVAIMWKNKERSTD